MACLANYILHDASMSLGDAKGNIGSEKFSFAQNGAQLLSYRTQANLHLPSNLLGCQSLQQIISSLVTASHRRTSTPKIQTQIADIKTETLPQALLAARAFL